jgi:vacuolar-type H+-ATPase subunit I/STV1
MCLYDIWALDVHWRPYGFSRFDGNMEEKVDASMESLYPEKVGTRPRSPSKIGAVHQGSYRRYSKFKSSKSLLEFSASQPVFGLPFSPSSSTIKPEHKSNIPNFETFRREEELAENLLQVKRERACTDVQMKTERERALQAERVVEDLRDEVKVLRKKLEETERIYKEECLQLQQELQEKQKREQQLKELNQEAYDLLILHGFQTL